MAARLESWQGRPVHRPRQGAAGQPLRWPHTRHRDPGDRDRSARTLPASSPTAAIVATTLRPTTSSSSISRARDAASQRPSNANSAADRQSNRSSDTPRPSTAWAEITSPEPTATPPTPASPPPATTSDACSNGWLSGCPQSWPPSTPPPLTTARSNPPDRVLHSRLFKNKSVSVVYKNVHVCRIICERYPLLAALGITHSHMNNVLKQASRFV